MLHILDKTGIISKYFSWTEIETVTGFEERYRNVMGLASNIPAIEFAFSGTLDRIFALVAIKLTALFFEP